MRLGLIALDYQFSLLIVIFINPQEHVITCCLVAAFLAKCTVVFGYPHDSLHLDTHTARPLAWAGPDDLTELHLRTPGLPSPRSETSDLDLVPPSAKKRSKKALNKQMYSSKLVNDQRDFGGEDPSQCRSSNYEM